MPLSSAKPNLQKQIVAAYKKVNATGAVAGADPVKIIEDLAKDLTEAIHAYVTQAQVSTSITVLPGIPVATAGSPVAQTGASTAPGSGTGTGNLS